MTLLRDLVIRMSWEGSDVPSVEVPLGDFFALGHGKLYPFESAVIAVGINRRALNCYWPMPFYQHARIEMFNNGRRSIRRIYYNIDYELGPIPPDQGLFHAVFRRDKALRTQEHAGNVTGADNYVILETEGRGQYAGCALFVDAQPGGWWGEGDEMIFIDHAERPAIIGTGSEDYFCNAWGFAEAFSYPYYGAPLLEERPDGGKLTAVYRWHVPDPLRFSKHIRVTIEHLFGKNVVNDYSSVAYWYQAGPIRQREPLPHAEENHPRQYDTGDPKPTTFELDATELEAPLLAAGVAARAITATLHEGYNNGGWLRIETKDEKVEIAVPVPEDGTYLVQIKPVNHLIETAIRIGSADDVHKDIAKSTEPEHRIPYVDLGRLQSRDRAVVFQASGQPIIGLDHLKIEKVE
jgi:hypothetical protein